MASSSCSSFRFLSRSSSSRRGLSSGERVPDRHGAAGALVGGACVRDRVVRRAAAVGSACPRGIHLWRFAGGRWEQQPSCCCCSAPNGIDFPLGATGRFSNGRTVVDVVGELIGLPLVPPYLDPSAKGSKILTGISFASGAAGIEDETGGNYAERITFWKQIDWFQSTIQQISSMLGPSAASDLVSKSLIAIIMGSNDYINNYFLPYTRSHSIPTSTFRDTLLSIFSKQIKEIYQLGGRKIVVANVGPLGCIPSSLFLYNSTNGGCIESVEAIVRDFNDGLKPMLVELNSQLPGATIVYGNVYNIFRDVIDHPAEFGFEYGNRGCCGAGPYNGQVPCLPAGLVKYCPDRTKYVFWDPYHPTDAANVVLGKRLFDGGLDDASPINIRQLCLS